MIYKAESAPSYQASEALSHNFEFKLFDCLKAKSSLRDEMRNTCLIIGFINTSEGFKYVVIPNSLVSGEDEDVEIKFVWKDHIEENFFAVDRPDCGILRKPKADDKVLCVAKGRYSGIQGGSIKKVLGMPEGRIKVWDGHNATYDYNYFVVVENSEYANGMTINSHGSTTVTDTSGSIRVSLIDPEIKKRMKLKSAGIISRREVETKLIEKRNFFTPKIIKRVSK